jgi:hypothetical protein
MSCYHIVVIKTVDEALKNQRDVGGWWWGSGGAPLSEMWPTFENWLGYFKVSPKPVEGGHLYKVATDYHTMNSVFLKMSINTFETTLKRGASQSGKGGMKSN